MKAYTSGNESSRLARNLGMGGGWYALYPPPRDFHAITDTVFTSAIRYSNGDPIPPQLALHIDVPAAYRSNFCHVGMAASDPGGLRAAASRERLVREIGLVGQLFDRDRDVVQVSLAPGLARWLGCAHVASLVECMDRHFHVNRLGGVDLAMTLDLADLATQSLRDWRAIGFNRLGINIAAIAGADANGVDMDVLPQLLDPVRGTGFGNLRIELPYGHADQSCKAFAEVVAAVIAAAPERIGLRHCPPRTAGVVDATSEHARHARMLLTGADALMRAGYVHIGVDVFARPDDPLAIAQRCGRLHRDALGFGVRGATHLVGFGVGAISQLGGCHAQNPLDQASWEASIDRGHRAASRGVLLSDQDHMIADILQDILCFGRIDVGRLERYHGIDFRAHFAETLARLQPLFEDGSLAWEDDTIQFDRVARLAAQSIASMFDHMVVRDTAPARLAPRS